MLSSPAFTDLLGEMADKVNVLLERGSMILCEAHSQKNKLKCDIFF